MILLIMLQWLLLWTPNSETDISYYEVYKSVEDGVWFAHVGNTIHPDTTYADNDLTPNVRYYYYVKALDYSGNASLPSDTLTSVYIEDTSLPVDVHHFTAERNGVLVTLKLYVENQVNVAGYRLIRSTGSQSEIIGSRCWTLQDNTTKVIYDSLPDISAVYKYDLYSLELDGGYYHIAEASVGPGEIYKFQVLQAYPNPCSGYVYIPCSVFKLFDITGKKVKERRTFSSSYLKVNDLPSGTYFAVCEKGRIYKIMVIR